MSRPASPFWSVASKFACLLFNLVTVHIRTDSKRDVWRVAVSCWRVCYAIETMRNVLSQANVVLLTGERSFA